MNAARFRQYAEDCRRMAERLPPDQKQRMLEIARAWDDCAKMMEDDEKTDDAEPACWPIPQHHRAALHSSGNRAMW